MATVNAYFDFQTNHRHESVKLIYTYISGRFHNFSFIILILLTSLIDEQ